MGFFGGGGATATMVGATASVAGSAGSVIAPAAGQEGLFLRGDATFANPIVQKQPDFVNATQKGYYITPLAGFLSGDTPTTNLIYLTPVYLPAYTYTSVQAIRSAGTTGAATTIRMGLYNCNPKTLEPTTLVFNTAETNYFSSSSNIAITISQAISAGFYWAAIVLANLAGSTVTLLSCQRNQSQAFSVFNTLPSTSANNFVNGMNYTHTGTASAMPSDLTGSTFSFTASQCPIAFFRV
jgi:hypothetical protein